MTKKIVFGLALALVIAIVAVPSAEASCNPPKTAKTYNSVSGNFSYWNSALAATGGASLVNKLWSGTTDLTGTCSFAYFGANAGDVGLNADYGDACSPGAECPAGTLSVLIGVTKGASSDLVVSQAVENPAVGVDFDFSTVANGNAFAALARPRVTNSSPALPNVNITVTVDAVAAGLYNGTAAQITGYRLLSKKGVADPGRNASSYDAAPLATIAAPGGVAGAATAAVVDCSDTANDRWVVAQVNTVAGPAPVVGEATRIRCIPSVADPKYKPVPKGKAIGTTRD